MSTEQWIFVFAGISALADFLAILESFGLLRNGESMEMSPSTPRRKWGLALFLFLVTMGLSGYGFYRNGELEKQLAAALTASTSQSPPKNEVGPKGIIMLGWGQMPPICSANINGSGLMDYSEKYDVVIVCGLTDPTVDKFEDRRITISAAHTIVAQPIEISNPFGQEMRAAFAKMTDEQLKNVPASKKKTTPIAIAIWYEVAVVTKGTNVADLARLSDFHRYGGKVLSIEH